MLQFPNLPKPASFSKKLQQIEVRSQALQHIPLQKQAKINIFHQQLLRSALFSARIEGNLLTLVEAKKQNFDHPHSKQKREISNVLRAIDSAGTIKRLTLTSLGQIHRQVMNQLNSDAGRLRSETSAIFDQYGNVVYLTPSPEEMRAMLTVWLQQAQIAPKKSWQEQLTRIACCHYYFEKIHPFLDGNGRTGRVVLQWQLNRLQIFADFTLPIDQFFDDKRSLYYDFLEKNTRKIDAFVQFFLDGISWSLDNLLEEIRNSEVGKAQNDKTRDDRNSEKNDPLAKLATLLPRRREIYLIIADHPYISLDMIARRFDKIPRRTLAYDLQQLVKARLVVKQGATRGVVYVRQEFTTSSEHVYSA